jgi:hypothetical protein
MAVGVFGHRQTLGAATTGGEGDMLFAFSGRATRNFLAFLVVTHFIPKGEQGPVASLRARPG